MGFINSKCESQVRLDGKTAIVTGSNTGIGKCTVKDFYTRGARVIMACRSLDKAEKAAEEIRKACTDLKDVGDIAIVELDLGSLESVKNCANKLLKEEKQINLLVNNAGIMFSPLMRTKDGFELQFGTNHLGHFMFTLLLMPKIIASKPARIVTVSSMVHRNFSGEINFDDLNYDKRPYNSYQAYYLSKLANILFTKELTKRLSEAGVEGVTTYCLHPGVIHTELFRYYDTTIFSGITWMINNFLKYFIKSPIQGAQTTIHCSVDENAGKETGLYYAECKPKCSSDKSNNKENATKMWNRSLKLVGLPPDYNPFSTDNTS